MANYDIIGSIAILKFDDVVREKKEKIALQFLEHHKNVKTVLEKAEKVSGRLRTIKTNYLAGENKKETIHNESGCKFKLNVENCYFSPRLSNERLEVAKIVGKKKNASVLVMFAGVAPYSIVIAKNCKCKKIVSIELGRDCCKYALANCRLNKVENVVETIQGDVKRIIPKIKEKFDFVVMPRPNLADSFLKEAFSVCKRNTRIIYYGFSAESAADNMISEIKEQAKKYKKKIKILNVKEAGDIAPHEHRYRIEMIVN